MDTSSDSGAFPDEAPMATDPPSPASPSTRGDVCSLEPPRSALQTTLSVASSAANLVLFPYVVAGRAAYQATSFAVTAPIKVTKHVANSLSESWQQQTAVVEPSQQQPPVDLFGERELESSRGTVSATTTDSDQATSSDDDDAPVVEGVLFAAEAPVEVECPESETTAAVDATPASTAPGVVSQLIFLPVRFVSSSVSTAAALPASAISLGGRTISGAMSTSQSLASSALVASGGLALRTTRHVASGITQGAFSTAHRVTGLVGSSVRTASYVIPPSVSNALWHGMERTGSMSTSVISYAIAVPTYRMAQALVPQVEELFTEQQLVDTTKDGVKLLVKLLGPQNAFYVLKFMYETVNSEEVYDAFLLVQDLVRESLDAENYKKAGSSVSEAAGIEALKPVVKSLYDMMPSLDELVDAALFVGEIADEMMNQVATMPRNDDAEITDTGRFELLSSEEEEEQEDVTSSNYESDEDTEGPMMSPIADGEAFSSESAIVVEEAFEILGEADKPADVDNVAVVEIDEDAFAGSVVDEAEESDKAVDEPFVIAGAVDAESFGSSFGSSADNSSSSHAGEDVFADLFNSSVSFFSSVLDSNEASMLLNTFGDFIDVLVE